MIRIRRGPKVKARSPRNLDLKALTLTPQLPDPNILNPYPPLTVNPKPIHESPGGAELGPPLPVPKQTTGKRCITNVEGLGLRAHHALKGFCHVLEPFGLNHLKGLQSIGLLNENKAWGLGVYYTMYRVNT